MPLSYYHNARLNEIGYYTIMIISIKLIERVSIVVRHQSRYFQHFSNFEALQQMQVMVSFRVGRIPAEDNGLMLLLKYLLEKKSGTGLVHFDFETQVIPDEC